jgi:hypothetical protein
MTGAVSANSPLPAVGPAYQFKPAEIIYALFVITSFFPWVGLIRFGTDTQPYALLFGLLISAYFVLSGVRLPSVFLWYAVPIMMASAYLVLADFTFTAFRSIAGYVSHGVLSIAAYHYYLRHRDSAVFFVVALTVYLGAGLIQLHIDPDFFQFLLPRETGYARVGGRGVESLTAEPTFFGMHLLIVVLYCWVSPDLSRRARVGIAIFALVIIVYVSRSATVFATLTVFGVANILGLIRTLKSKPGLLLIAAAVAYGLIGMADPSTLEEVRFVQLVSLLIQSFEEVLLIDQSLNERFFEVVISLTGFLEKPLFGHGFDQWGTFVEQKKLAFEWAIYAYGGTERILSFLGAGLFELGIGFLPVICLLWCAARIYERITKVSIWPQIVLLGLLLLQALPLTYPLVPLYIGRAFALDRRAKLSR